MDETANQQKSQNYKGLVCPCCGAVNMNPDSDCCSFCDAKLINASADALNSVLASGLPDWDLLPPEN